MLPVALPSASRALPSVIVGIAAQLQGSSASMYFSYLASMAQIGRATYGSGFAGSACLATVAQIGWATLSVAIGPSAFLVLVAPQLPPETDCYRLEAWKYPVASNSAFSCHGGPRTRLLP